MSTIAIGDVHGNRAALDDLLARLRGEVEARDTVVFLGDYIDRGPDSKECIDSILRFRDESPANVVTLLGNHEDWLLKTLDDYRRHSWLTGMDGFATIESYSTEAADLIGRAAGAAGPRLVLDRVALPYEAFIESMPQEHLDFFRALKTFHRTEDAVCVHAGLDPRVESVEAQTRRALLWGTAAFLGGYAGPDMVMYGHWNNADLDDDGWPRPAIGRATIGIDTIAHGVLTAFRLPDRRVFQSARLT